MRGAFAPASRPGRHHLRTFWMSVMSVSLMTLFLFDEPDLELELSKHR